MLPPALPPLPLKTAVVPKNQFSIEYLPATPALWTGPTIGLVSLVLVLVVMLASQGALQAACFALACILGMITLSMVTIIVLSRR